MSRPKEFRLKATEIEGEIPEAEAETAPRILRPAGAAPISFSLPRSLRATQPQALFDGTHT